MNGVDRGIADLVKCLGEMVAAEYADAVQRHLCDGDSDEEFNARWIMEAPESHGRWKRATHALSQYRSMTGSE